MYKRQVTIPGDTSGSWLTDNGTGITLTFCFGSGSTRLGTAGSWQTADLDGATGSTSVVGTNGATWMLTGVQVEAGSIATLFERRSYGQELALCQRYYQKTYGLDVTPGTNTAEGCIVVHAFNGAFVRVNWNFHTPMRTAPSITIYSTSGTVNSFRNIDDNVDQTGAVAFISTGRVTLQSNNTTNATGKLLGAQAVASSEL